MEMGTWKLVPLPHGQKPVKCKWVFMVKADGYHKACHVEKGFTHVHRTDYEETFSLVLGYESI